MMHRDRWLIDTELQIGDREREIETRTDRREGGRVELGFRSF